MINPAQSITSWLWPAEKPVETPWKSLQDQRPELGQRILIWDGDKIYIDTYAGWDQGHAIWYEGTNHHKLALYWLELPEPPK